MFFQEASIYITITPFLSICSRKIIQNITFCDFPVIPVVGASLGHQSSLESGIIRLRPGTRESTPPFPLLFETLLLTGSFVLIFKKVPEFSYWEVTSEPCASTCPLSFPSVRTLWPPVPPPTHFVWEKWRSDTFYHINRTYEKLLGCLATAPGSRNMTRSYDALSNLNKPIEFVLVPQARLLPIREHSLTRCQARCPGLYLIGALHLYNRLTTQAPGFRPDYKPKLRECTYLTQGHTASVGAGFRIQTTPSSESEPYPLCSLASFWMKVSSRARKSYCF